MNQKYFGMYLFSGRMLYDRRSSSCGRNLLWIAVSWWLVRSHVEHLHATPSNSGIYAIQLQTGPWCRRSNPKNLWGCPRGVMVKAMDCGIVVREFVLQSCYYVHFRANTLGKGMNPLILPAMGKIVPLLFF